MLIAVRNQYKALEWLNIALTPLLSRLFALCLIVWVVIDSLGMHECEIRVCGVKIPYRGLLLYEGTGLARL